MNYCKLDLNNGGKKTGIPKETFFLVAYTFIPYVNK